MSVLDFSDAALTIFLTQQQPLPRRPGPSRRGGYRDCFQADRHCRRNSECYSFWYGVCHRWSRWTHSRDQPRGARCGAPKVRPKADAFLQPGSYITAQKMNGFSGGNDSGWWHDVPPVERPVFSTEKDKMTFSFYVSQQQVVLSPITPK